MKTIINSIGIYVPANKVGNSYFENILDTSDEWIRTRTGIETRHFASEGEYTSDLCVNATEQLMKNYNKSTSDVDFIIVATSTSDQILPSVASQVQNRLNIKNAGCIDISAACAGFVYGIILAKGLIASGTHSKILVIGAETLSKVNDMTDRSSCILFGDGAGAVIVEASEKNYLFNALTDTNGAYGKDLYISNQSKKINGVPIIPDGKIHQNGRTVFKWAVNSLTQKIHELAQQNNIELDELDWIVPHSANIRILESVCKNLNFPLEKCLESIRHYGNTSAASVPIAWYNGIMSGKIKVNDNLLLAGFGGGLTFSGICINNQIERK